EWRWALTGNYLRARTITSTDRADLSGLATRIAAGDPALDPFAADLGQGLGSTRDVANSLTQNADANATIAGSPFLLPAGPVTLSATSGFEWRAIDSESRQGGVVTAADLSRRRGFVRGTVELPLTSRRDDVLAGLGDISVNGNFGYGEVSDFGGLIEYGYGVRWEPVEGLSLIASVIGEETAPGVSQLGDPVIVTPNVSLFDFATGQSVLVERISGGNPALLAEQRRDFKLTANYRFGDNPEIRLLGEYIRNRSENVSSGFPLLTPEIEAAFPDRVVRDGAGNLLGIDARPVDFAEVRSERIRYGATLSGELGGGEEGRDRGGRRGGEGRRGGGAPPSGDAADAQPEGEAPQAEGENSQRDESRRGGPPSPMGMLRGRGRGGDGGRWRLSLFHTYRIDETVLIRPGVPELDLLGGSVTGGSTPVSRHGVELEGGVFLDGIGLRVSAEYTGSARIDGGGLPGSSDLYFGDLATVNLRAFFNFDSRPGLIEDIPFLAGSRLALRVDNLLGGVRRVEDANGDVPLAYQPGYLDPRGRYVELSFRKRF
ncbi:MAG: TonB-dependent receptor, partial [Sphingomonadales bacterium]|nr:TonB-dependent receptor [Sphingomonadales bacterium]